MSLILAVLAQAAATTAIPPAESANEEIVVIGDKLGNWKGVWRKRKGAIVCKTTKSTGDRSVDAIGCESLVACGTPLVPEFDAIAAQKLPKAEINRQLEAAAQRMGPCVVERRAAGVRALAERRTAG